MTVTNEFASLDSSTIEQLITAPISGILESQSNANKQWIETFNNSNLFFNTLGTKTFLRVVSFNLTSDTADSITIEFPVILLAPLPVLNISDFNINFKMNVNSHETNKSLFNNGNNVTVKGSIGKNNNSNISKTTQSTYDFNIQGIVESTDGMSSFLDICSRGIRSSISND